VLKTESKRAMENFVQRHMQDFAPAGTAIRTGDTVEEIIDYADKKDIDLIILASHSCTKAEHRIYGSIAEAVNRDAGCPVMIIHPEH
ncbi:MAG: universal stress protein, partial [Thermodesulfobacteriota bacterium]